MLIGRRLDSESFMDIRSYNDSDVLLHEYKCSGGKTLMCRLQFTVV